MSVFLDIADDMKTVIESKIPSSDIAVIVDRQSDLKQEFKKYIGKVKGGVAIIEFLSSPSVSDESAGPRLNGRYAITLWAKNLLRTGKQPLDDILETICKTLHQWKRVGEERLCYAEVHITDVRTVKNPHFLIYQISLKKIIQL